MSWPLLLDPPRSSAHFPILKFTARPSSLRLLLPRGFDREAATENVREVARKDERLEHLLSNAKKKGSEPDRVTISFGVGSAGATVYPSVSVKSNMRLRTSRGKTTLK